MSEAPAVVKLKSKGAPLYLLGAVAAPCRTCSKVSEIHVVLAYKQAYHQLVGHGACTRCSGASNPTAATNVTSASNSMFFVITTHREAPARRRVSALQGSGDEYLPLIFAPTSLGETR